MGGWLEQPEEGSGGTARSASAGSGWRKPRNAKRDAPRKVAHVWAHVGEGTGRLIVALQPAGEIEAFFGELAKLGNSPQREELRRVLVRMGSS